MLAVQLLGYRLHISVCTCSAVPPSSAGTPAFAPTKTPCTSYAGKSGVARAAAAPLEQEEHNEEQEHEEEEAVAADNRPSLAAAAPPKPAAAAAAGAKSKPGNKRPAPKAADFRPPLAANNAAAGGGRAPGAGLAAKKVAPLKLAAPKPAVVPPQQQQQQGGLAATKHRGTNNKPLALLTGAVLVPWTAGGLQLHAFTRSHKQGALQLLPSLCWLLLRRWQAMARSSAWRGSGGPRSSVQEAGAGAAGPGAAGGA